MAQGEWYGDEGLPPVVLAAGLDGGGAWWEPNIGALSADYRVLVVDPAGPAGDVAARAGAVAEALDAAGVSEPVGFVGLDLGGLVGLQLAADAPARVQRLAVVNGWGALDAHTSRVLAVRERMLRLDPALDAEARPLFGYPPAWIAEHEAALRADPAADPAALLERIDAIRGWRPGSYRLGLIEQPVLCLGVEDDQFVPVGASEALAGMLSQGRFASFASGGHAVNVTRPHEFALRVQDWLR